MSLIDNQSEMVKCPKCGMTIHNTSAFCVNCGKMLRSTIKVSSSNSNVIVHPKFGKGTIVEDKGLTVKMLFADCTIYLNGRDPVEIEEAPFLITTNALFGNFEAIWNRWLQIYEEAPHIPTLFFEMICNRSTRINRFLNLTQALDAIIESSLSIPLIF